MSVALIQEVRFAVGYKAQPDLKTPVTATDMFSLRQTNTDFIQAQPINEDDTNDLGKGVYATQTFPSHINAAGNWNGRLTSEAAAMMCCYGIGGAVETLGSGFSTYTMKEPIFETAGLNLPVTTMLLQIRSGANAITDKLLVGMACEEFGFEFRVGPGRDNALFTSAWIGTGGYTKPSGYVMPTVYQEHSINAGGITTLDFIGFDYLANLRFVNFRFGWKNNLRDNSSYFPGSGSQGGYQLRGRMRRAAPTITLTTQVECDSGSSEEDALLNQMAGTGMLVAASGTANNSLSLHFYKIVPLATPIADADGIASYNVTFLVMQDPTNGVMQIINETSQAGIGAVGP
jgi:hypothetical protein